MKKKEENKAAKQTMLLSPHLTWSPSGGYNNGFSKAVAHLHIARSLSGLLGRARPAKVETIEVLYFPLSSAVRRARHEYKSSAGYTVTLHLKVLLAQNVTVSWVNVPVFRKLKLLLWCFGEECYWLRYCSAVLWECYSSMKLFARKDTEGSV